MGQSNQPTDYLNLNQTTFNGTGKLLGAAKARASEGGGGMFHCSPRKFSVLKALKRHFQTLRPTAVSKRFRKVIVIFFSNFDEKRTEIYVCYLLPKPRKIVFFRLVIHHNNRNKSINLIFVWNQANKQKKSMRPGI